jgi:hypothetical protein
MQGTEVVGVAIRVSLAVASTVFRWEKFAGGKWTALFRQIGLGDWLRRVTGGMQMTGAEIRMGNWLTAEQGRCLLRTDGPLCRYGRPETRRCCSRRAWTPGRT